MVCFTVLNRFVYTTYDIYSITITMYEYLLNIHIHVCAETAYLDVDSFLYVHRREWLTLSYSWLRAETI